MDYSPSNTARSYPIWYDVSHRCRYGLLSLLTSRRICVSHNRSPWRFTSIRFCVGGIHVLWIRCICPQSLNAPTSMVGGPQHSIHSTACEEHQNRPRSPYLVFYRRRRCRRNSFSTVSLLVGPFHDTFQHRSISFLSHSWRHSTLPALYHVASGNKRIGCGFWSQSWLVQPTFRSHRCMGDGNQFRLLSSIKPLPQRVTTACCACWRIRNCSLVTISDTVYSCHPLPVTVEGCPSGNIKEIMVGIRWGNIDHHQFRGSTNKVGVHWMMIHYEIPVWESCHCILYFRVHVSMTTGNDVYMCCAQSVPVTISAREWSDRFSPIQSGGWNRSGRWPRYRSYVSLTVCTVALLYRSYKGYLFTRVTQSIITGNGQATSVYAYLYIYTR